MLRISLLITLFFGMVLPSKAQELRPYGHFHTDSAQLGEVIPYSLIFKYPRNFKVVFPDSTYDYSPFELDSKHVYHTVSDSASSKDSVVYYLSSFEIDPILELTLPVFLISNGDSSSIYTIKDSVIFKEMITVMPDSVALEENTEFIEVTEDFNYPYLLIALGLLFIFILSGFLTVGKSVRDQFRLFRLRKKYEKFSTGFDERIQAIEKGKTADLTEQTLVFWKSYMEKVKKLPFKKLTTKEISSVLEDNSIRKVLQEIDRTIYGGHFDEKVLEAMPELKKCAFAAYEEAIKNIKHA